MVLLGRSRISCWPRYLVLITGPRQTISIDCEICETNHSYRGRELVTARPSSTCTGMIRKSGAPDEGNEIEMCGGVDQRPIKTARSASHRARPSVARVDDRSLC